MENKVDFTKMPKSLLRGEYLLKDVILSVLSTNEPTLVLKTIEDIKKSLGLSEPEKKILETIKEQLEVKQNLVSVDYVVDKFSYYFDGSDYIEIKKSSIPSVIAEIKIKQDKLSFNQKLLKLSSNVDKLTVEEIKEKLTEIASLKLLTSYTDVIPDNALVKRENAYEEFKERKQGLTWGIVEVEKYAGKVVLGTFNTIAAFTGSYKSTYAFNIAYANAKLGYNVLYLALEDTEEKIVNRLVLKHNAVEAKGKKDLISNTMVRDDLLDKSQVYRYNEMYNDLVENVGKHLLIWDTRKLSYNGFIEMSTTLRKADNWFMGNTGKGLDAIVVDQLSLLKYTEIDKKTTYDGAVINEWVSYFRNQAMDFLGEGRQIVVFGVAQTTREAFREASKEKRKGMYESSCVSDAHETERASSTMVTLFKDWDDPNIVLINIPKARDGYNPEYPIQAKVYGQYSHIGELKVFESDYIDASLFNQPVAEGMKDPFKVLIGDLEELSKKGS